MTKGVRSIFYLALLGVTLLTIALVVRSGMLARKNPGRPITEAAREAAEGRPQLSEQDAAFIAAKFQNVRTLPSGLMYVPRATGSGLDTPKYGAHVTASYEGKLLDGTPFDRSDGFTFRLGMGQVIKGWDDAFADMRRGEKRTLIVPYWLGYGTTGREPRIPARATLIFEVELIDWR